MIGEKVELVLSPRATVMVAEMDGAELGNADIVLGAVMAPMFGGKKPKQNAPAMFLSLRRVYAICSIRSINGNDVKPFQNIGEYLGLAKQLGGREIAKLQEWAAPVYFDDEEADEEDGEDDEEGNE